MSNLISDLDPTHGRARKIVEIASKQVKNPSTKSWLFMDERGTWEKMVRSELERTADKAKELGLSESKVNEEIAAILGLRALEASLEHARKHEKQSRRRTTA